MPNKNYYSGYPYMNYCKFGNSEMNKTNKNKALTVLVIDVFTLLARVCQFQVIIS